MSPAREKEKVRTHEENNMATLRSVKGVGGSAPNVRAKIPLEVVVRAIIPQAIYL